METPDAFRYIPTFEDESERIGFQRKKVEDLSQNEREYFASISEHEKSIQYHRQQIQELAHRYLGKTT